jgi:transposase InsO family protein
MKCSYPMRLACELLEVSVGGYCSWQRRHGAADAGNARRCSEATLLVHMRAIHAEVKGEYGWPRMHKELLARGLHVGKERVRTLMQRHGIKAKTKRKFVVTTGSKHKLPVAPDLVQRRCAPPAPNQLWCSDITYIHTDEGWLHLAAAMDLFSRQVVGWSLQSHMQTSLVKDALAMAQWRRRPAPGLILHSDRGSQYCSHEFQGTLRKWKMRSSMSRKGNCWDNSPTESLWGRLKTAMRAWTKVRDPRAGQAGGDGLDGLLQSPQAAFNAEATSAPCSMSSAGTRHSVKRPRRPWAKSYTKQGQDQARILNTRGSKWRIAPQGLV